MNEKSTRASSEDEEKVTPEMKAQIERFKDELSQLRGTFYSYESAIARLCGNEVALKENNNVPVPRDSAPDYLIGELRVCVNDLIETRHMFVRGLARLSQGV